MRCSGNIHVCSRLPSCHLQLPRICPPTPHQNRKTVNWKTNPLVRIGAGLPVGQNRTKWPMNGGNIQIIPGWNAGHPTAFFYVNMGYGNKPVNHSNPMTGVFQITGPSRDAYPGSFCLRQVPLPVNATEWAGLKPGDNVTIQVIQVALHGASLYNVSAPFMAGSTTTYVERD